MELIPASSRLARRNGFIAWLGIVSGISTAFLLAISTEALADDDAQRPRFDPSAVEFFEKKVRPVLVEKCQTCHGPEKQKAGLRLDTREAILTGGSSGPAIVPGDPESSVLIDAINYGELYQMPPKSKLPAEEIDAITSWVKQGAAWGVDSSNPASPAASADESEQQTEFWCFQPVRKVAPPARPASEAHAGWSRNPIDSFLLDAMEAKGLTPSPETDKRTLIRRITFDLTGLAPTVEEINAFLADDAPDAYDRLVDRLLASPRYGERWARHWLDLARFAETAGHEFDYNIPNASRYRDYVIRAMNADLPYNEFVIEQIAGDLLPSPRRHPTEQSNESILGTGFLFLGEGVHSPVDLREEQMSRIDNQIDVLSKTFLGLTISCARCHDHKFDPISAQDYYALAGFLKSSRHQQAFIDSPEQNHEKRRELTALKETIRGLLRDAAPHLPSELGESLAVVCAASEKTDAQAVAQPDRSFAGRSFAEGIVTGDAFGDRLTRPGDFRLAIDKDETHLVPLDAGFAHSGILSDRFQGVLRFPTFTITKKYLHSLVVGKGGRLNLVIDGFEKIRDPIYGGLTRAVNVGDSPKWITQDVSMWVGHRAYIEFADGAATDFNAANTLIVDGNGSIGIAESLESDDPRPPGVAEAPKAPLAMSRILAALRSSTPELAQRLESALNEYRKVQASITEPRLGLAIMDGTGEDEFLLIRGNHRTPGKAVPRRFLKVLGHQECAGSESGSGRLELAQRLVDPATNPLVTRVIVNRLWKQHFGTGLVASPDDFGAMGQKPSHPELLDWLAAEFVERGWSLKAMHRLMVTSQAYRMSSRPRDDAEQADPNNLLVHRMNVRRLEAEAIRDSLLQVSGRIDRTMFGASVMPYLSPFMDGRGRPEKSGPLDGDGRRSIYLCIRRNFLNPFLLAFDAPVPFSTMGRRNLSNVPAQALTLMNDPLVVHLADLWADRLLAETACSDAERLTKLYEEAFGRRPTEEESERCLAYLAQDSAASRGEDAARRAAWANLCHVMINVKEFIYIP